MILSWVLLLSGCRFYEGPRNQSGCPDVGRDLGSGRASTTLRSEDWTPPIYPMDECGDDWDWEQTLRWTPTRTGPVEISVQSSQGPVGVGFMTECPDFGLRACGVEASGSLQFSAVAGEPVVLVVQGYEEGEVVVDVRELAASLDTDEPVDTGLPGGECGDASPEVTDFQVFNASNPGAPAVGIGFVMEDADGALHAVFPWLYVDDVVDGVVDPSTALRYGFADPITDYGDVCVAYGPYELGFSLLVGTDIPYATELEFAIQVVDADGLESDLAVAAGWTPDENGQDVTEPVDTGLPPAPPCVQDPFEPNDELASPTPLTGDAYGFTICGADEDWFSFVVQPNEVIDITVAFVHADGDLDASLVEPSGTLVDNQVSTTDNEVFTWMNDTTAPLAILVQVYGYAGAENTYDMLVARQTVP